MTRAIAASALAFCVILGRAEAQSIDDMEQVRFAVPVTEAKAPRWAETAKPDLVTVCFGYNDWTSGMRGPRFKETMAFAADRIRRMTGAEVLLMTTCPAMERRTEMAELAQAARTALFCGDKTHLSARGHQTAADAVFATLRARGARPDSAGAPEVRVHSITDIAHEFTFYFDGRFGSNYVKPAGGADARNWAALRHADLAHANLLVLQAGASMCPFTKEDIDAVRAFLQEGGGVAIIGEHALFKHEKEYRLNGIARELGAEFTTTRAEEPLAAAPELAAGAVRTYGGKTIALADAAEWRVLITDARGRTVMARRAVGKGSVLVCSRALVGRNPDAKDPINDAWWQPLLQDLARGKAVDPARPPRDTMPEVVIEKEGLKIQHSEYLAPYAEATFATYTRVRPVMERLLGVPPSKGMIGSLILLPTGGGGFSSGATIGLGIWWGDFPEKPYGMMELLGHEAMHSWVLPFAEPLWNEGIATYVGILVGRELGQAAEADAALKGWLDACARQDPDMTKYDLTAQRGVPHEVAMAKPMWIWEQLRKEKPDILARYFKLKRQLLDPTKRASFSADDSVELLSRAMGRDLFPWFASLGIKVDKARVKDL